MARPNVLLTGHRGFIGSRVKEMLQDQVTLTTLSVSEYPRFEANIEEFKDYNFDLILHLGAISNSQEESARLWQMNVAATELLCLTFADRCKLAFASSYSVQDPITDYARTKLVGESIVQSHFSHENRLILRIANVWADDESEKANPSIVYKYRNGLLTQLYKNWYRDFVHVSNVARFIANLPEMWASGLFYLGTGYSIPCSDLAIIFDSPKPVEIVEHPHTSYLNAPKTELPKRWGAVPIIEYFEEIGRYQAESAQPSPKRSGYHGMQSDVAHCPSEEESIGERPRSPIDYREKMAPAKPSDMSEEDYLKLDHTYPGWEDEPSDDEHLVQGNS